MAKKHKNLFDKIACFDSLLSAFYQVRKGKRKSKAVLLFELNLEDNLFDLVTELQSRRYRLNEYCQFKVYEPKERLIRTLPIRDRVVQRAIHDVLYPIYNKMFIDDSYACRKYKGTHAGADRVTMYIRQLEKTGKIVYCLKCDIHKYFYSIDREVLKGIIKRKIGCEGTLWLLSLILDSSPEEIGIPLGNLTSQLFANIYLNELDQHVKHCLKKRFYIRYMDDFLILSNNKAELAETKLQIEIFLQERLGLLLNHKTQIFPVGPRAVDFLGYRIYSQYRLLRNDSKKRFKKKVKLFQTLYRQGDMDWSAIRSSIHSWIGHCSHANTYSLRRHALKDIYFSRHKS